MTLFKTGSAIARLLAIVSLVHTASAASATELGIGVGVGTGVDILHLTARFPDGLRIEPYLGHYRTGSSRADDANGTSSSFSGTFFGVGAYGSQRVSDSIEVFGGGRLGYRRERERYSSQVYGDSGTRTTGYMVAPTVGFEYFFHRQVSIGAEVSYLFNRVRGEDSYGGSSVPVKSRSQGTMSAITLRYYL